MMTTRNMRLKDSTEMTRMLQQKMKEMQQCHEANLVAFIAENPTKITQEKTAEEGNKIVQAEQMEHNRCRIARGSRPTLRL